MHESSMITWNLVSAFLMATLAKTASRSAGSNIHRYIALYVHKSWTSSLVSQKIITKNNKELIYVSSRDTPNKKALEC